MRYRIDLSVNIRPVEDDERIVSTYGNSLSHWRSFEMEGDTFQEIAPKIDGLYAAVQKVIEGD